MDKKYIWAKSPFHECVLKMYDAQYTLFALFDGHGGNGTSLKLANELHIVVHQVRNLFMFQQYNTE